jgi:hypothetical protein
MQSIIYLKSLKDQLGFLVTIILGDDSLIKPKTFPGHRLKSIIVMLRPREEGTILVMSNIY